MTTAHNEHTGASLTTAGKGSLDKYAQGFLLAEWDAIFGKKAERINQCDGCRSGWPIKPGTNLHKDPLGRNHISCTKEMYV